MPKLRLIVAGKHIRPNLSTVCKVATRALLSTSTTIIGLFKKSLPFSRGVQLEHPVLQLKLSGWFRRFFGRVLLVFYVFINTFKSIFKELFICFFDDHINTTSL